MGITLVHLNVADATDVMRASERHVAPAGPKLASGTFSGVEGSTLRVYNKEIRLHHTELAF